MGKVPFTDGAPISAADFDETLPVSAHADSRRHQLSERSIVMSIHRKLGVAVVAVLTAGLAACGGGGYDGGNSPPPPPREAGADDRRPRGSVAAAGHVVAGADLPGQRRGFGREHRDSHGDFVRPTIIPAAGIVLGGSGANRTLQITPAPEVFGNAMITIRAADPDGLVAQQVIRCHRERRVRLVHDYGDRHVRPLTENGEPRSLRGFTFTQDADDDPAAFDSLLQ